MTAVVKEVYEAFKKAGVPEQDAWDAAAAFSARRLLSDFQGASYLAKSALTQAIPSPTLFDFVRIEQKSHNGP